MSDEPKLKILVTGGVIGVGLGLALDPISPIIKKIYTSSFIIISLGFSLLFLAIAFWIIDILKFRRPFFIPIAVGMNPLFIYLFARAGGADLISRIIQPFFEAILGWAGQAWVATGTALGYLALMCLMCYLLAKYEMVFKI